jgi:uncharacterized protein (DUF924 family)
MAWHEALLDFWFGLDPARHWQVDPALDAEIAARFGRLLNTEAAATPAEAGASGRDRANASRDALAKHLRSADHALAAVILFDQFPRNIFRGHRRAFATDRLARSLAESAADRGFDGQVAPDRRLFFYLPFEHSEDPRDQARSVRLIAALGRPDWAEFAVRHRDVIARFGRFPHRNAILGRQSTEEEQAFGLEPAW